MTGGLINLLSPTHTTFRQLCNYESMHHPFMHFRLLIQYRVAKEVELIQAAIGGEAGHTPGRTPICHRL